MCIVVPMVHSDISGTLRTEAAQAHIIELLGTQQFPSRRAFVVRVCEDFDFLDAKGDWQVSGCMKALYGLERKVAQIVLPAAAVAAPNNAPRLLDASVPAPQAVPAKLRDIQGLYVEAVTEADQRKIWNTLIAHEHPEGIRFY